MKRLDTGRLIKAEMILTGINQKDLSFATGITESSISRHIANPEQMTLGEFWKIMRVLKPSEQTILKMINGGT